MYSHIFNDMGEHFENNNTSETECEQIKTITIKKYV